MDRTAASAVLDRNKRMREDEDFIYTLVRLVT
jgi:hypothetical protein